MTKAECLSDIRPSFMSCNRAIKRDLDSAAGAGLRGWRARVEYLAGSHLNPSLTGRRPEAHFTNGRAPRRSRGQTVAGAAASAGLAPGATGSRFFFGAG